MSIIQTHHKIYDTLGNEIMQPKLLEAGQPVTIRRDIKFQNLIADIAHTYTLDVKKASKGTDEQKNKKIAMQGQVFSLKRQRSEIPMIPPRESGVIVRNGNDGANVIIDLETFCALLAIQKDMGSRATT